MSSQVYDLEKNPVEVSDGSEKHPSYIADDGAVPGETFTYGDGFYAKAQRFAGKLKIEQRGIERVPEDERTDTGFKSLLNVATMVSLRTLRAMRANRVPRNND